MELVLASNFDDALVAETSELPVETFFGNYPVTLTGGGRPPHILPSVSEERFRAHLAAVHRAGRRFYATLNSTDLGLKEYDPGFVAKFLAEVGRLLEAGVDGFVVALPILTEIIHREHPDVPLSVSTFARIRTVTQAEYFVDHGADTVVLEEANRDFSLIEGLVARGVRVEVLTNQTCLQGCPFRAHHLNTSSLASQPGNPCPAFELPILECGLELARDPARIISTIFVRPEDLALYEEAGVHRFKVSGRNRTTEWLVRAARAYASRRYTGNLLDILSYVQVRGPARHLRMRARSSPAPAAAVALRDEFNALEELTIDNSAFPPGFLRRIRAVDCEHTSCRACGYCAAVASRVVRIGGRPLSERLPLGPTPASTLLPDIGWTAPSTARAPP